MLASRRTYWPIREFLSMVSPKLRDICVHDDIARASIVGRQHVTAMIYSTRGIYVLK